MAAKAAAEIRAPSPVPAVKRLFRGGETNMRRSFELFPEYLDLID
ncbi:hypothetical protein [Mangrovicoccus sp. HB161399]|nr:hypothetical protein [Mangrovicoccus sp. HB161399]